MKLFPVAPPAFEPVLIEQLMSTRNHYFKIYLLFWLQIYSFLRNEIIIIFFTVQKSIFRLILILI